MSTTVDRTRASSDTMTADTPIGSAHGQPVTLLQAHNLLDVWGEPLRSNGVLGWHRRGQDKSLDAADRCCAGTLSGT
jgi:hypothetical protein